jgi:hypothetical protein
MTTVIEMPPRDPADEQEAGFMQGLWERVPAYDRRKGWGWAEDLEAWRSLATGEIRLVAPDEQKS